MIRMKVNAEGVVIRADAKGLAVLAAAVVDARAGREVFIGEPPGLLVIAPEAPDE